MTIQPRLTEEDINGIINVLREKKYNLNSFQFKYSAREQSLLLDGKGIKGINQTEEYYEAIEDNLVFADFNWISPLCEALNINFTANLKVLPEGDMEHNKVRLVVTVPVPVESNKNKQKVLEALYNPLKRVVKFQSFVKEVVFFGNNHMVNKIDFIMEVEGKKIVPLLRENPGINLQCLNQWVATVDKIIDYGKKDYKYVEHLQVANGRMANMSYESTISFRFQNKNKKEY
ncbi:hypothetical protein NDK25_24260 [Niallia taxi]|nr:hypothetical protein [Niallia taxi]MDE5055335.1 hypothetical protein [Niallia taxi]